MSKRIKLTEKQINKAINEISYGTVDDAKSIGYSTFSDLWHSFWQFDSKLEELEEQFKELEPNLYQNRNFNAFRTSQNNPYMNKIYSLMLKIQSNIEGIREASDTINGILERKEKQNDNFENSTMKYDAAHQYDDISWDDYKRGEINNV